MVNKITDLPEPVKIPRISSLKAGAMFRYLGSSDTQAYLATSRRMCAVSLKTGELFSDLGDANVIILTDLRITSE